MTRPDALDADALHADALGVLREWAAPSAAQSALRDRYVAHLAAHRDGLMRECSPDHVTASLLVLDDSLSRVLLTHHAKAGRWFQLGGHTEPGDATLAGAALREGVEESGLGAADLTLDPVPLVLDAHVVPFCGPGPTQHLDVMFRATAPHQARPQVSAESLDVAWWPVDDLPNPELAPFVDSALERARSTDRSAGSPTREAADHSTWSSSS